MSQLLESRLAYKPFKYPWAFEAYKAQQRMHWLPEEVPLREDVRDWNHNLNTQEKNLLTQIFRFFTQGDVEVAKGYLQQYIPTFGGHPELAMMMSSFAAMEGTHIDAYSLLLDTVGMPESEYSAFLKYTAMADKYNFVEGNGWIDLNYAFDRTETVYPDGTTVGMSCITTEESLRSVAKALAVYSAFTEGLQLFSSFIILLNFPRHNKMKGMGQIVTWSIRDESLHVESMIKLFRTFIEENISIWNDDFKAELYSICRTMVDLEDNFIDLAFEQGGIEGLTPEEMKLYIRYIADRRLLQLGLKPNYGIKDNPLDWVDSMLNGVEHANFFETRATEYNKGSVTFDEDMYSD